MTISHKDASDLKNDNLKNDDNLSSDKLSASNEAAGENAGESADKNMGKNAGMSAEEALIAQVAETAKAEAKAEAQAEANAAANADSHAATDATTDTGEVDEEIGLEAKVADLEDRLSRSLAEGENSRRRFERDRADALRYGASRLAMDMFEVADNLRRACGYVSAEARAEDAGLRNLVIGVEMTEKLLGDAFSRHGIVAIAPEVGSVFSANEHQAVSEVESEGIKDGCIVEVVLRGYRMGEGRLLRPAQVITAKSKNKGEAETATETATETENEKPQEKDEKTE